MALKSSGSWQLVKVQVDYSSITAKVFPSQYFQVTIQRFHIPAALQKLLSFARKSLSFALN